MDANQVIFPENEQLFPPVADSSRLLVGCRREEYSASRIAHAVEDCNAHVLNLNVTSFGERKNYDDIDEDSDAKFSVIIDLRVDHRSPESVCRSLERYGYTVLTASCESGDDSTTASRIDELIHYLGI